MSGVLGDTLKNLSKKNRESEVKQPSETKTYTSTTDAKPPTRKTLDKEAELRARVKELEKELSREREGLKTKRTPYKDCEHRMVALEPKDWAIFEEFLKTVPKIKQPPKLGLHEASHNQFIRSLFTEFLARLNQLDFRDVLDEDDIQEEISRIFTDPK